MTDPVLQFVLVEPIYLWRFLLRCENFVDTFLPNKLYGTSAILADVGEKCRRISRRDLKPPAPRIQGAFIIRKQTP